MVLAALLECCIGFIVIAVVGTIFWIAIVTFMRNA